MQLTARSLFFTACIPQGTEYFSLSTKPTFSHENLIVFCISAPKILEVRTKRVFSREVTSSVIRVDGQDIVRQVFACPDGNFTTPGMYAVREVSSGPFDARSVIQARSASECTTPAAECQCGQSIICGCYGESTGPSSSDCSALIASLPVVASIQGPTFIVQPITVHTTTLRTCAISFINLGETPEEYCWDELASTGNGEVICMQEPPYSDAVCMATSQRFEIHLGAAV